MAPGAGGGSDFIARIIAQGIAGPLGQPVIVENRPTLVIAEVVSKSSPDGYTLLIASPGLWVLPLIEKAAYDPVLDFAPITLTNKDPLLLVVHPSVPVKSVKELIALAKTRPGEINYGSTSIGTPPHLAGELFKTMTGVRMVGIPYKSAGPAIVGLISGEVPMMLSTNASLTPYVRSGKLRALAVTSARPSALFPELPTVAATVPGYEVENINAIFAPGRTPAAVINRLNQEIVRVINRPEVKETFLKTGVVTVGSSPDELAATVKLEIAKWGKVIKAASIRAD